MYENLQTIVGTAIVDANFRRRLLDRPSEAVRGFDLTSEEREAVCSIRAKTFQAFARELDNWINKQKELEFSLVGC